MVHMLNFFQVPNDSLIPVAFWKINEPKTKEERIDDNRFNEMESFRRIIMV